MLGRVCVCNLVLCGCCCQIGTKKAIRKGGQALTNPPSSINLIGRFQNHHSASQVASMMYRTLEDLASHLNISINRLRDNARPSSVRYIILPIKAGERPTNHKVRGMILSRQWQCAFCLDETEYLLLGRALQFVLLTHIMRLPTFLTSRQWHHDGYSSMAHGASECCASLLRRVTSPFFFACGRWWWIGGFGTGGEDAVHGGYFGECGRFLGWGGGRQRGMGSLMEEDEAGCFLKKTEKFAPEEMSGLSNV